MADSKTAGVTLLSSTASVALDAANGTEKVLYTVPTGFTCTPIMVVMHTFDEAIDECVVTFGKGGGSADEFLGDQTLTNITAGFANECLILQPLPNATPAAALILDAAETFVMEITTKEATGTGTATVDVYGKLTVV